jgi:hypothetical protein
MGKYLNRLRHRFTAIFSQGNRIRRCSRRDKQIFENNSIHSLYEGHGRRKTGRDYGKSSFPALRHVQIMRF